MVQGLALNGVNDPPSVISVYGDPPLALHEALSEDRTSRYGGGSPFGFLNTNSINKKNTSLVSGVLAAVLCAVFLLMLCLRNGGMTTSRRLASAGYPKEDEDSCYDKPMQSRDSPSLSNDVTSLLSRITLMMKGRSPEEELVYSAVGFLKKSKSKRVRDFVVVLEGRTVTVRVDVKEPWSGGRGCGRRLRDRLKIEIERQMCALNRSSPSLPQELPVTGRDGNILGVFSVLVKPVLTPREQLLNAYDKKLAVETERFLLEAQRRKVERDMRNASALSLHGINFGCKEKGDAGSTSGDRRGIK